LDGLPHERVPAERGIQLTVQPAVRVSGIQPARAAARPYIEVKSVSQIFRRGGATTHALDQIDLTVAEGEFVAIVGPSGCGKSTLLRSIAGLLKHTSGSVRLDGKDVLGAQTNLGIVFQSPVLLEWRNVLDNVLLQLELRDVDPKAYVARAHELLAKVGLGEFHDRRPRELSGGMRQRAAIVRALIHDPPLLLMDEPFGALDALTREQMRIDLEELWMQTGKTVLFITHSIDEAVLLADRVIVMSPRPGRIEQVYDITIARPRGLAARSHPLFVEASRQITELFLSKGILRGDARR
jgi:NitT/TauT family transport system ATP-binding protein